ncbi:MAG: histidinol-phosphate transaminase [Chlorobi bacterium]|nr:histidinol-phosphate transaminase [Chlorobiota bacterium]
MKYLVKKSDGSSRWRGLKQLLRPNIASLKPYSSARDEFSGADAVFFDANENPFNAPYNRYPDPYQKKLKEKIAALKGVKPDNIFLGNGSDEAIDLLFRAFSVPGKDNVVSIDPTYGMYQVAADINDVEVKKVLLKPDFSLDVEALLSAADGNTKMIFICSPNNPTANSFSYEDMEAILQGFGGIVVVDEAYIDFAPEKTLLSKLEEYPNLVVLQTFSKAWGVAAIRLGMAFASEEIIAVLSKIKYPYNINILTQEKALELLENEKEKQKWVEQILAERERLVRELKKNPLVKNIYPSDANFILITVDEPEKIYNRLVEQGIIIRDRSKVAMCEGCLRITVGTQEENDKLIEELKKITEK